jgi:hypothetical protein
LELVALVCLGQCVGSKGHLLVCEKRRKLAFIVRVSDVVQHESVTPGLSTYNLQDAVDSEAFTCDTTRASPSGICVELLLSHGVFRERGSSLLGEAFVMKPLCAGDTVPELKEVVVPAIRLSPGILVRSVADAAAGVLVTPDAVVCWRG